MVRVTRRHPWKTKKYIRFENTLMTNGHIAGSNQAATLGDWLNEQLAVGEGDRTFKACARELSAMHGSETVTYETVRTWFGDWVSYEWRLDTEGERV